MGNKKGENGWKWKMVHTEMGAHALFLIEERWLSQLESVSEEVVTALLEYIRCIHELIVTIQDTSELLVLTEHLKKPM